MVLYPTAVLGDDEVCTEAGHTLVGGKLLVPVCGLGALRRNFYLQAGLVFDERILPLRAAGDHRIRVLDDVVRDAQFDALRIHPAIAAPCGSPETARNIDDDPVVPLRGADHREDLATNVLVANGRALFEAQIFFDRQELCDAVGSAMCRV